jgi:hypothetical protein
MLHLGANKTGSSYIQEFIARNHLAWRAEGVLCPTNDLLKADTIEGYHVWSLQRLLESPKDGALELKDRICALFEECHNIGRIVLSAENLISHPQAPELFDLLSEEVDLSALVYIRRQDDYLLSSWQQWSSKVNDDYWAWALRVAGSLGDWQADIRRWLRVIPQDRFQVRLFQRDAFLGGELLTDFYQWLGCQVEFTSLNKPTQRENKALSIAISDLVAGNGRVFANAHDPRFYEMVKDLTGERFLKQKYESAMTLKQRLSVIQKYSKGNIWVRDNFFPKRPASLFDLPTEVASQVLNDEARRKTQLSFLASAVFELYQRQQG